MFSLSQEIVLCKKLFCSVCSQILKIQTEPEKSAFLAEGIGHNVGGLVFNLILFQVCFSAPIDLVKVRLQGQTTADRYCGPVHCIALILKEDGPRGLFRGGAALILRDVPCYGLYFLPYMLIREALTEPGKPPGRFQEVLSRTCNCSSIFTSVQHLK